MYVFMGVITVDKDLICINKPFKMLLIATTTT